MIVFGSFVSFVIWYVINEVYVHRFGYGIYKKNYLFLALILMLYAVVYINQTTPLISFFVYVLITIILTFVLYIKDIQVFIKKIRKDDSN
jgi:hypothetical protein